MLCPRGHGELQALLVGDSKSHACRTCRGEALSAALLRRMMSQDEFRQLWPKVRTSPQGSAPCPSCSHAMRVVTLPGDRGSVVLDACPPCQSMWFDAGELATVAPHAADPAPALDAPMPIATEREIWRAFFRRLNAHRDSSIRVIDTS